MVNYIARSFLRPLSVPEKHCGPSITEAFDYLAEKPINYERFSMWARKAKRKMKRLDIAARRLGISLPYQMISLIANEIRVMGQRLGL